MIGTWNKNIIFNIEKYGAIPDKAEDLAVNVNLIRNLGLLRSSLLSDVEFMKLYYKNLFCFNDADI